MKFVAGENGRNPEKNLPRLCFFEHETHMERPGRELWTPTVGDDNNNNDNDIDDDIFDVDNDNN